MNKDKPEFLPDFFTIPWQVWTDRTITPLGAKVFATIYWYEKMRDGYCHANNATIARIVGSGNARSVSNSIQALVESGYLVVEFTDPNDNNSRILKTLVSFTKGIHQTMETYTSNDGEGIHQTMEYNKNNKKEIYIMSILPEITKLYEGYLIEFIIGIDNWVHADAESRISLMGRARTKVRLTEKRKAKISARIEDLGFTPCAAAIKHCAQSEFHRGENERRWVASIEWIFGSLEKTEEWSNRK